MQITIENARALDRLDKLRNRSLGRLLSLRADSIQSVLDATDAAPLETEIEDISEEIVREHTLLVAIDDCAGDIRRGVVIEPARYVEAAE